MFCILNYVGYAKELEPEPVYFNSAAIDWTLSNLETKSGMSLTGYSWLKIHYSFDVKVAKIKVEYKGYSRLKLGSYIADFTDGEGNVEPITCFGLCYVRTF